MATRTEPKTTRTKTSTQKTLKKTASGAKRPAERESAKTKPATPSDQQRKDHSGEKAPEFKLTGSTGSVLTGLSANGRVLMKDHCSALFETRSQWNFFKVSESPEAQECVHKKFAKLLAHFKDSVFIKAGGSKEYVSAKGPTRKREWVLHHDRHSFELEVLARMADLHFPATIQVNNSSVPAVVRNWVEKRRTAEYSGPIAGWKPGLYEPGIISNGRVFVTEGPSLVEAAEGDWPVLRSLFEQVLGESPEHRQADRFYGWLLRNYWRVALSQTSVHSTGLLLCGATGVFKTFIQRLVITPILGNRDGDPFEAATGKTDFNSDLFGAEHLRMGDKSGSSSREVQQKFTDFLKAATSENRHRCHPKHKTPVMLTPIWVLTLSVNDSPDALQALPDLFRGDVQDKILALYTCGNAPELPIPYGSPEEKKNLAETVQRELPAFLWWLLNAFKLPDEAACPRFGVKGWIHPKLHGIAADQSNGRALLDFMDAHWFPQQQLVASLPQNASQPIGSWCGGAGQLIACLSAAYTSRNVYASLPVSVIGSLLAGLSRSHPDRVKALGYKRIKGVGTHCAYEILPPPPDPDAPAQAGLPFLAGAVEPASQLPVETRASN